MTEKVSITNLGKVERDLRKRFTKQLRSKDMRKEVAEVVVDAIRDESMGVVTNKATIAWREYLEEGNDTHTKYRKRGYNATFTGALLDDFGKSIKADFSDGKVSYEFQNTNKKHKKYKKPDGKLVKGKAATFAQISDWLLQLGYPYMILSNLTKFKTLERIKKILKKRLR